ncbi:MAG: hypothetical protein DMG07_02485 [Acidobacteria bacterium]|nr:MAG: hypothetical protein DMG07_02485 [Acidobacteriota bacterium]
MSRSGSCAPGSRSGCGRPRAVSVRSSAGPRSRTANREETRARVQSLTCGLPAERAERTPEQQAVWVLAHLLDWHRREAKPEWWKHFELLALPIEELADAPEALGGLRYLGRVRDVNRSVVHRYGHDPEQEHKFKVGDQPIDPATGHGAGVVVEIDQVEGTIDLRRGRNARAEETRALIPARPIKTNAQSKALGRVADYVIARGLEGAGAYRCVRDLLLRTTPRVGGVAEGESLCRPGEDALAAARRLAVQLDESYLPVQGPPGSGKTFTGARMIVELLKGGRTVGITATAHKAITNLVDELCRAARNEGQAVRAVQKCEEEDLSRQPEVTIAEENGDVIEGFRAGSFNVAAGTPWLFSRDDMQGLVDVLFVDEAGQMSLANVVAMGGAARSLVLLGDPNQLPQVTKGTHPEGAGASALDHVLGELATVPPDRGLFLAQTWRLHPEICSYISAAFYEGRLQSEASTRGQAILPGPALEGTGLRLRPVSHARNSSRSPEEAATVVETVAALVGRSWTNQKGETRPLTLDDILIVAPYNLQVAEISRALKKRLGDRGRVGTVDKFQGQEGALVLYSTATSSPDDAPRDVEFLYSRNRLNVALSRARALAVLVCSPDLFRIRCRTPEEMRMANAFCLFREAALEIEPFTPPRSASRPAELA